MKWYNPFFFQQILERTEAEVHFSFLELSRVNHTDDQIYWRKQETYKTALLSLIPKSQRKVFFISHNAEDVLTQWIFILPPLFPLVRVQSFRGNKRQISHSENFKWHKNSPVLLTIGFGIKNKTLFFFLSLPVNAHSRKWPCRDIGRH